MSPIEFWQFTDTAIKEAGAAALIKVVESKGSSPGKQKFMMAVTSAGKIAGTIGGGAMENKMINAAKEMLAANSGSPVVQLMVHRKNVPDSSGLICSGSQTNAIIPLNENDLGTIESIIAALQNRADGYMVINQSGLQYFMQAEQGVSTAFKADEKGEWEYRERYGKSETVYVVGSGHVGLAICRYLNFMGYYVVCFDCRENVPTVLQNTYANKFYTVPYENIGQYIDEGENSYVLIVTSERDTDNTALKQVIDKDVKFIGLMGSAVKRESIFKEFRGNGISEDKLKKVHSPIGLKMNSFTPDEIAVSIAAQIIHVKNGG